MVSKYEACWNKFKKDIYDLRIYFLELDEIFFDNYVFDFFFDIIIMSKKSVKMILKILKII